MPSVSDILNKWACEFLDKVSTGHTVIAYVNEYQVEPVLPPYAGGLKFRFHRNDTNETRWLTRSQAHELIVEELGWPDAMAQVGTVYGGIHTYKGEVAFRQGGSDEDPYYVS